MHCHVTLLPLILKLNRAMNNRNSASEINITSPITIRIEVNGFLDNTLSDFLGGLSIQNTASSVSYVEGVVADQAALVGIINTLFNMRFPIINVKIKNNAKAD
jgi:hypothetical protein